MAAIIGKIAINANFLSAVRPVGGGAVADLWERWPLFQIIGEDIDL